MVKIEGKEAKFFRKFTKGIQEFDLGKKSSKLSHACIPLRSLCKVHKIKKVRYTDTFQNYYNENSYPHHTRDTSPFFPLSPAITG
jgi:hypothetical protein